jgi:hypothetical protein
MKNGILSGLKKVKSCASHISPTVLNTYPIYYTSYKPYKFLLLFLGPGPLSKYSLWSALNAHDQNDVQEH